MKVRKNLEAVFIAAAVLANFTSYAAAQVPAIHAVKMAHATSAAPAAKMQVVVVKAKRLTAAQKALLD